MKYKELYLDLTELCKDLAIENEQLKSQLSSTDKVIASGQVEYIYHKDDVVALVIGGKLVDEALAFSIIEESGLQGKQVELILREVK